jgi:acrylyl-CoA reductase (NADPH)
MTDTTFPALLVRESPDGTFSRSIVPRRIDDLPDGDVLVRVLYSSLNYKDALSAVGNRGVTKRYPHVPGIDAAGIVEASSDPTFVPGNEVVVTGYELGANHDGGFSTYIRVPASWVVRRPAGLSLRECMMFGTAGLTAALSVQALLHHGVHPSQGPVVVTGASGGVGSIAVGILAASGFRVIASTGKPEAREVLLTLGAEEVRTREDVQETTGRGMVSARWAGAVDTVGGLTLDSVLRQTMLFGAVAACGNVTSGDLHTSIYPFILRGVALLGINSAFTPMPLREATWARMAGAWNIPGLSSLATEISLAALDPWIDLILQGRVSGRVLVHVSS